MASKKRKKQAKVAKNVAKLSAWKKAFLAQVDKHYGFKARK